MRILAPDLVYVEGAFRAHLQVEVRDDGTFGRIGPDLGEPSEILRGEALLPGMVNAHSHAFQRGLRGKAESYPKGRGSFWSWREAMYELAGALDQERFRSVSFRAFREMLRCGITSVGEFHYLHHLSGGRGYELDAVLIEAARDAGIRMRLLDVCYRTGDVDAPLEDTQLRFGSESVEAFLASAERAGKLLDPRTQSLGVVAHSIRAVPLEEIVTLHRYASDRGLVFHMHVEEQEREIEASIRRYGARPLELLLDRIPLGRETTAVHCTHSTEADLTRLAEAGATVCVCPLTEASLADGTPPEALGRPGMHLALGTDSNHRIDFLEEMRWLEYAQRLRSERRGIFTGDGGSVAERLFRIATEGGARALGLDAGRIATGRAADYFTVSLDAPALEAVGPDELLAALVLAADGSAVRRVVVGGRQVA